MALLSRRLCQRVSSYDPFSKHADIGGGKGIMADSKASFEVFLSHGSPDKPWVRTLHEKLTAAGISAFLDEIDIAAGDNFVRNLSDGIERSSTFVIVVSLGTTARPWVEHEWTSFLATHGPRKRIILVRLDDVSLPAFLNPYHAINALDRNADRVVAEIVRAVGKGETPSPGYSVHHELTFVIAGGDDGDHAAVTAIDGRTRSVLFPWRRGNSFVLAFDDFEKMTRVAANDVRTRALLTSAAEIVGAALFDLLFSDEVLLRAFVHATSAGPRAVVTIRSDDDQLLALPWELLAKDGRFLVRDGVLDIVRTTTTNVQFATLLPFPRTPFTLVTNVSAPEGSALNYEEESFRITHALTDHCEQTPTELGTLEDLLATVRSKKPTGIHFSGHGVPGALVFEDDEGFSETVSIDRLVTELRRSSDAGLPPFFFLASCHGNTPARPETRDAGSSSSAAQLHREGATEVVGFYGPIADELSTRAEEALYAAISRGETTRSAVAGARAALLQSRSAGEAGSETNLMYPFAFAQLVFYHRGPENPLGTPASIERLRQQEAALKRTFRDPETRAFLETGFIGRRRDEHQLRRRRKRGDRVFVLQGLGGLGKTTLAGRFVATLADPKRTINIWCREVEKESIPAEALVGRLLAHCRARFGADWENVVSRVDRTAGARPTARFMMFLQALMAQDGNLPTVLHFDNLESLLQGPDDVSLKSAPNSDVFGGWRSEDLQQLWRTLVQLAEASGTLFIVASCRYRNADFEDHLVTVSPLDAADTFRLMAWFPSLRRLSIRSRMRLTQRLSGHPRAVQFADDLVRAAIRAHERRNGDWIAPNPRDAVAAEREWTDLIVPHLPNVDEKIWGDLLLGAIWDRILDEAARRMLFRISLLRRPFEEALTTSLGEEDQAADDPVKTAQVLASTSLLEECERMMTTQRGPVRRRYLNIHASTASFTRTRFPDAELLVRTSRHRIGTFYEGHAKSSSDLESCLEGAHHLFEVGEYDRAYDLASAAAMFLIRRGRVREALFHVVPFESSAVNNAMTPNRVGRLLGLLGLSYAGLGENRRAVEYYEQRLAIARELGDVAGEAATLGNLGIAYDTLGETRRAIEYHEQRLFIARRLEDRRGECNALGNLGIAYDKLGENRRAIEYHEQALVLSRELRERVSEGQDLGNLGNAYAALGETRRAIEYHEQSLAIARETQDHRGVGDCLGNLGSAYFALGELSRAIDYHEQRLAVARSLDDQRGESATLYNLGEVYARLGEKGRAIEHLEQALIIGRRISDPSLIEASELCLKTIRDSGT